MLLLQHCCSPSCCAQSYLAPAVAHPQVCIHGTGRSVCQIAAQHGSCVCCMVHLAGQLGSNPSCKAGLLSPAALQGP